MNNSLRTGSSLPHKYRDTMWANGGSYMTQCSRRSFLRTGLAAGVLAGTGNLPLRAARGSATDWVTLGKSGVKVTRLAFGTGSVSGKTQRDLGQEQFTKLVRHA